MEDKDEFPILLYKSPGPHKVEGGTITTAHAKNQEAAAALLKKGFHKTLPAALEAAEVKASEPLAPPPSTPAKGK